MPADKEELAAAKAIPRNKQNLLEVHNVDSFTGLSQGYLSRLHAGDGTPSAALVALLTLLAREPHERLRELELCWTEPHPATSLLSSQG